MGELIQITNNFTECYPDGVPAEFPVELFEPTTGTSLIMREQRLRDRIDELQHRMLQEPQAETPVRNLFAGGVYAREVFIPKGTLVVGKVHVTDHINIALQGDLTFLTVDGPKRFKAPGMFAAPAGTKKLAYANEDSIWVNVHPALHEDPEFIVSSITVDTYAEYDDIVNRVGYQQFLEQFQLTEEYVRQMSEDPTTLDDSLLAGVEVRESRIQGMGLFSTESFKAGEVICPAQIGGKRSLAGRYSNHHMFPNCVMAQSAEGYDLTALRNIEAGEELTTDYGATLSLILEMRK